MNSTATEHILRTHDGGIVYDPSRLRKAGREPDARLFERDHWLAQGAVETSGGRGSVLFIRDANCRWVLRHYRRGGWMANVSTDRYLWTGANATRSFREWRLLSALHARGLPVPVPVAARYVRSGLTYTADLLTEELPQSRSLAQALSAGSLPAATWQAIGTCIRRFHRAGAYHADLNAHNILLGSDDAVYLLDFDRGRLRPPGTWQQAVLDRLLRSLRKLQAQGRIHFNDENWRNLLAGYAA
jgi:3-deoxy-D-manno-octulosonic acid kinase